VMMRRTAHGIPIMIAGSFVGTENRFSLTD
jgi:hypothetical protein